jgi:hypothetical protein
MEHGDIHNPSIPSANGVNGTNGTGEHKTLAQLAVEKENMEAELSALSSVLDSVMSSIQTSKLTCIAWREHGYQSDNL